MMETYGVVLLDEVQESRLRLHKEVGTAGVAVVGEAGSSQEAYALAQDTQADAVLISVEEPVARSLRAIESLALALPDTPIIAVSTSTSRDQMRKSVLAGARDFLSRPLRKTELLETLAVVAKLREKQRSATGSDAPLRQGTIMTVFGPKGGVGKTTLAINLGVFIASQNKERVLVVDLDSQVGAASVMLNIIPQATISDLLHNLRHIDRDLLKNYVVTHSSGLDLLPSALWSDREGDDMTPHAVGQLLSTLASYYDYVIVDTPPQLSDVVLRALEMSTYIFLMTSLEVASIHATKRVLDKIATWEFARDKIKVVTNVSNSANSLQTSDIATVLGFPVFWSIPHDTNVAVASQIGQPLMQINGNSKASKAIQELRYTLTGTTPAQGRGINRLFSGWRR